MASGDVFISYARSTAPQAERVAEALRSLGYSVWRDDELPAHRAYTDVIEERLKAAKAVLVIWSAEAVKSQWVRSEADRGRGDHKLVQLSVDGSRLPMPFDQIQCADLKGWTGNRDAPDWRKVVASIADLIGGAGVAPALVVDAALALPSKPSIAVMRFTNLSGDPEQDFFADGMAEDIITALSKLRWFFVTARNSTFTYKEKSPDLRHVARELGVRYVLDGSVRKAGDRMRIAVQLIDGVSGNHIWAEHYDRQVLDIFSVQDDITRSVIRALEPQLYVAENLRIQSEPTESLDAWECVIRGLWHLGHATKDDSEQARQLLRQAVSLSPRYAKAHSVLSFAEARTVFFGGNIGTALSKASQDARTGIELDGDDAWGYFSSGYVECFAGNYDDAIAWYRRAIELNENFALAHGNMAAALALGGYPDAAIEAFDRSMRMSPRDPFNYSYLHYAAIAYFAAERYAEGAACEEQALRERPNFSAALRFLAACQVNLGQLDKARNAIAEVLRLVPESSIKRDVYGQVAYARASDRERYAAALRNAGLPEE
jgi:TolB-like protein/tetratricopeptide (TPR) repeat protein